MRKKIIKITLLVVVFGFWGYILWQRSPLCASYYFNKGKQLYNVEQYDASVRLFQRSLAANPNNPAARYFLALALSKGTPTYSNQESLYLIANSKTHDTAQNYAKTQIISLKKRLLEGLEGNYIYSAILNKDILRWNTEAFPLKVYFDEEQNVPQYYRDNIKKAMEEWSRRSNFIEFTQVTKPDDCDIYVRFKDYDGPKCTGPNCKYTVAVTSNTTDSRNRLTKMTMTFYKTNPLGQTYSETEIYNTALHETGHALGISGHSDYAGDVMYSNNHEQYSNASYNNGRLSLTMRDLNTLALLYRLAPTITNMRGWYNENLYYAPLILGNEDEILEKKLAEYKKYVEQYPNYCGGYINMAAVYSSMGNNKLAKDSLTKAEFLATNDDEKYLIHYNKSILYYNNQDFNSALESAKDAQRIKDDENVESLINDIKLMMDSTKK